MHGVVDRFVGAHAGVYLAPVTHPRSSGPSVTASPYPRRADRTSGTVGTGALRALRHGGVGERMALLYRAIWRDARPDLFTSGERVFVAWLRDRDLGLEIPCHGTGKCDGASISVARVDDGSVRALRMSLHEESAVRGGSERWTTTAHWMSDGSDGWVWVDLERVSDDAFASAPDVIAPELVGRLLDAEGVEVGLHLGPRQRVVKAGDVDGLLAWIEDEARPVPVIVFSLDPSVGPEGYAQRVRHTAERLAGCADVRMLLTPSEEVFVAATHASGMSVYEGAARVYLPGARPGEPEPWRHPMIPAELLTDRPSTAAVRISRVVLPRVVAQRPPMLYRTQVKQLLDRSLGADIDWQGLALDLDGRVTALKAEVEALLEEKDLALLEALDSELEAADALQRLDGLRARLSALGEHPDGHEVWSPLATEAQSCAEAVALAAELEHVVVHPEAPRDIDRMDQSPASVLWGQRLWNHLRSLDAYAAEKGPGFATWCETAGHPRAISSKFIAMSESESVCSSPALRRHRLLPVDEEVDPSGFTEMFAHLKPVQGGGLQVPRVYFHDDTKGFTGKVHIGFIGPHDLMPNLQTN